MKFFIDTANLDQIKEAQALGVLDGVTTNPSLMAKEGITGKDNILKHYVDICNIVDGDVSAEVIGTTFDDMIREGEELADLHDQIVVKVPMIRDGVKALRYFTENGIRTNCTLIFSPEQALLAAIGPHHTDMEAARILLGKSDVIAARAPHRRAVAALAEADPHRLATGGGATRRPSAAKGHNASTEAAADSS